MNELYPSLHKHDLDAASEQFAYWIRHGNPFAPRLYTGKPWCDWQEFRYEQHGAWGGWQQMLAADYLAVTSVKVARLVEREIQVIPPKRLMLPARVSLPRPRLLDLFCGAGGAGMGYHRAGFDVTGVDIAPQKNYPFRFVQADALEYLCAHWHEYDVIHASPPCQRHTLLNNIHKVSKSTQQNYDDLLGITSALLRIIGKPYVIENVIGAQLINPITLCGKSFNLKVYRHRLFESNVMLIAPAHQVHKDKTPSAGHGISPKGFISIAGNGGAMLLPDGWNYMDYGRMAMGIDWIISRRELSEAIPPAYTEYIGRQMLRYVQHVKPVYLPSPGNDHLPTPDYYPVKIGA